MAPVEWNGVKINVLDAPGYADFIGDVRIGDPGRRRGRARRLGRRRRRGPDRGRLGARGRGGPAPRDLRQQARPRAGLVRAHARPARAGVRRRRSRRFELPIGEEHDFEGVADLLHDARRTSTPPARRREEGEWPEDIAGKADPAREKLIEAVAESDDALIEQYLEEGELSRGRRRPRREGRLRRGPARAGAVRGGRAKPIGVDRLLDFIVDEFPSPIDRGAGHGDRQGRRGYSSGRATRPARSRPSCSRRCPTPSSGTSRCSGCSPGASGPTRPSSTPRRAPTSGSASCSRCGARSTSTLAEVPAGDIAAVAKLAAHHHRRHVLRPRTPR